MAKMKVALDWNYIWKKNNALQLTNLLSDSFHWMTSASVLYGGS